MRFSGRSSTWPASLSLPGSHLLPPALFNGDLARIPSVVTLSNPARVYRNSTLSVQIGLVGAIILYGYPFEDLDNVRQLLERDSASSYRYLAAGATLLCWPLDWEAAEPSCLSCLSYLPCFRSTPGPPLWSEEHCVLVFFLSPHPSPHCADPSANRWRAWLCWRWLWLAGPCSEASLAL